MLTQELIKNDKSVNRLTPVPGYQFVFIITLKPQKENYYVFLRKIMRLFVLLCHTVIKKCIMCLWGIPSIVRQTYKKKSEQFMHA